MLANIMDTARYERKRIRDIILTIYIPVVFFSSRLNVRMGRNQYSKENVLSIIEEKKKLYSIHCLDFPVTFKTMDILYIRCLKICTNSDSLQTQSSWILKNTLLE